jgi:hypothetical protein
MERQWRLSRITYIAHRLPTGVCFVLHHLSTSFLPDDIYSSLFLPIMSIKQLIFATLVYSVSAQIPAKPVDCSNSAGLYCCAGSEGRPCSTGKDEIGTCEPFVQVRLILKERTQRQRQLTRLPNQGLSLCSASDGVSVEGGLKVLKTCSIETKDRRCLSVDLQHSKINIGTCVIRDGGSSAAPQVSFSIIFEDKYNS